MYSRNGSSFCSTNDIRRDAHVTKWWYDMNTGIAEFDYEKRYIYVDICHTNIS